MSTVRRMKWPLNCLLVPHLNWTNIKAHGICAGHRIKILYTIYHVFSYVSDTSGYGKHIVICKEHHVVLVMVLLLFFEF